MLDEWARASKPVAIRRDPELTLLNLIARSGPRTWIGVSRMPDPMTGFYEVPPGAERVEVITSVQRRRRWSTEEKVRIVSARQLGLARLR